MPAIRSAHFPKPANAVVAGATRHGLRDNPGSVSRSEGIPTDCSPLCMLDNPTQPTPEGNPMAIDTHVRRTSMISRVVSAVFGIIALVLILHIVFVMAGVNSDNGIVRALSDFAGFLAWGFKDLFSNANIKLQTFLNYGLAALVYLAIGAVLSRLFRNLG
jgi:hypothetical protein